MINTEAIKRINTQLQKEKKEKGQQEPVLADKYEHV